MPTSELQQDIIEKLMLKGIEKSDVDELLPEGATFKDLYKLAISYSDGIIQSSENVDPELLEFARSKGIPVLEYQPEETFVDSIIKFYEEI
jgi:starch synthase